MLAINDDICFPGKCVDNVTLWVKQPVGVITERTLRHLLDLVMERISGSRQAAAVFSSALILPIILHLLAREEGNKLLI